jgi:hypothetical protein
MLKEGARGALAGLKSAAGDAIANLSPHALNRIGGAAMGAGVGAIGGAGIHAATGIAGAVGGVLTSPMGSPVHSTGSVGGMLGAGLRGAMIGGAIGGAMGTSGAHKAFSALGAMAPKTAGRISQGIIGANARTPGGQMMGAKLAASLDYGRLRAGTLAGGSGLGFMGRMKEAGSMMFKEGSRGARVGATAMAGGLGYAAYSSNAMGLGVPGNYGYR